MNATIDQIMKADSSSVWVLNKSNPRGTVNFTVSNGMGSITTMTVPVTYIPIDLTTQAEKNDILKNPQVRRMIMSRVLELVTDAEAAKLLKSKTAQDEQSRIYRVLTRVDNDISVLPAAVQNALDESSGEISAFAMQLCAVETDEDEMLNQLRIRGETVAKRDLEYITAQSGSAKVKQYCAEQLLGETMLAD